MDRVEFANSMFASIVNAPPNPANVSLFLSIETLAEFFIQPG